ncbi:MAG TPA: glycerophosphoryl diester phosphodiesterase [Cycloclasticus sp.]|nr:glycerophosphoryl diester phosphodiesterase [Cycloclasticus sp.]
MLSISHRDAMAYAPENTVLAIKKAIERGAHWVEIDVRQVAGQLLVIHDETLDRTTNGTGRLCDYSVEQLRIFDAGEGECIPLLDEVIEVTKGKVGLNIEIKGHGVAILVNAALSQLSLQHKVDILVSSFQMSELQRVTEFDGSINIGVLVGSSVNEAFDWAQKLKAYSIHFSQGKVTQELVNQAHSTGLKLYVYIVNEMAELQKMKTLGVDAVLSNYPCRVSGV